MAQIYDDRQAPAYAGMKGDSRLDTVESFAAETAIPIGAVVTAGAKANQVKVGGTVAVGVALHTHTIAIGSGYQQYDSVSVLTRGLVWCTVKGDGTVTDRGAVKFDPATGQVSDTASTELPNAVFRSGVMATAKYGKIALVELHAPQK